MLLLQSTIAVAINDFLGSHEVGRGYQIPEHISVDESDDVRECLGLGCSEEGDNDE